MISPDLPIASAAEDILDRSGFARSLARTLLRYSSPSSFAVGLYGQWGSGKTSLMNMVLEAVEAADSGAVIVRFDPWLCTEPKQLIAQFFKRLSGAIRLKKPAADQTWELIDRYSAIFDAAGLIPFVGTAVVAAGRTLASEAQRKTERNDADLQGSKDRIAQKLREENIKIIVAIDDIDRLSEEEIIAVFQLVKALADFPNMIYLLAFDYAVVVEALGKVQHGDGRAYLEKVIQVPFEIPAPGEKSIRDALFRKLDQILGDVPEERWDAESWTELYHYGIGPYIRSLRDVIRYTNVFSLKYALLKDETDAVDLLGLTCLQVFEPPLYSRLPGYKSVLCGGTGGYSYESQRAAEEKVKAACERLTSGVRLADSEAAWSILGLLFPRVDVVKKGFYGFGRSYDRRGFLINNNISVPECFDRYFSLTLEDGAVPTAVTERLIYDADEADLTAELDRLYGEGGIIRLLEQIEAYANRRGGPSIPPERAALLITCLARRWDSFDVEETGFITVPFQWRLLFCVDPLLKGMEPSARYPFLRALFADKAVQPATLALILNDLEAQHGRFTEKGSDGDSARQAITLEEVLELESIFKARALEALDTGAATEAPGRLDFLWLLEQIDPGALTERKAALVSGDVSLLMFVSHCTGHGKTGGRVVYKSWAPDLTALGKYIDVNDACERVRAFMSTADFAALPERTRMDAAAFVLAMESSSGGEGDDTGARSERRVSERAVRRALEELPRPAVQS